MAKVKELREGVGSRMQAKFRSALAQREAEAGRLDEAITEYAAALERAPDPDLAVVLAVDLAVVLLKKGDAAKVLDLLASNESPLARYQKGLAHFRLGRPAAALRELDAALRTRPEFVEARYQLGVTLLSLGRPGDAERALGEATRQRPDDPAIRRAWAEAVGGESRRSVARASSPSCCGGEPPVLRCIRMLQRRPGLWPVANWSDRVHLAPAAKNR